VGPRSQYPPIGRGKFEGTKGHHIVKQTLRSSVQQRLNLTRCRLGCGLGSTVGVVLDGGPAVLRDVAMATNFGMQFVVTGFWAITLDV